MARPRASARTRQKTEEKPKRQQTASRAGSATRELASKRASNSTAPVSAPLSRAAQILDVVSTAGDEGLPLHKIATAVRLPPSTTHRLIRSLLAVGFLALNEQEKTYGVGRRLIRIMHAAFGARNIQALAEPILLRLVRKFGQVFYINQLLAEKARVVAFVMPNVGERPLVVPGEYSPIHASAGGKAIFAFHDEATLERQLAEPLTKFLPNTITDPNAIREELARVRKQGYALTRSEFGVGITAMAVPVEIADAGVVFSIGMAGFESQLFELYPMATYINALRSAAVDFRSALGAARGGNGREKRA